MSDICFLIRILVAIQTKLVKKRNQCWQLIYLSSINNYLIAYHKDNPLYYIIICLSGWFVRIAAHRRQWRSNNITQMRGLATGTVQRAIRWGPRAIQHCIRQQWRVLSRWTLRTHAANTSRRTGCAVCRITLLSVLLVLYKRQEILHTYSAIERS